MENRYKKTLVKIAAIFSIIAVFSFGIVDKGYANNADDDLSAAIAEGAADALSEDADGTGEDNLNVGNATEAARDAHSPDLSLEDVNLTGNKMESARKEWEANPWGGSAKYDSAREERNSAQKNFQLRVEKAQEAKKQAKAEYVEAAASGKSVEEIKKTREALDVANAELKKLGVVPVINKDSIKYSDKTKVPPVVDENPKYSEHLTKKDTYLLNELRKSAQNIANLQDGEGLGGGKEGPVTKELNQAKIKHDMFIKTALEQVQKDKDKNNKDRKRLEQDIRENLPFHGKQRPSVENKKDAEFISRKIEIDSESKRLKAREEAINNIARASFVPEKTSSAGNARTGGVRVVMPTDGKITEESFKYRPNFDKVAGVSEQEISELKGSALYSDVNLLKKDQETLNTAIDIYNQKTAEDSLFFASSDGKRLVAEINKRAEEYNAKEAAFNERVAEFRAPESQPTWAPSVLSKFALEKQRQELKILRDKQQEIHLSEDAIDPQEKFLLHKYIKSYEHLIVAEERALEKPEIIQ